LNDPFPPRTAFRKPPRSTPRTPKQSATTEAKTDEHGDAQFEPELLDRKQRQLNQEYVYNYKADQDSVRQMNEASINRESKSKKI